MSSEPQAIIIGSGPNGLVAACVLARAGIRSWVLEANTHRAGGAVGSDAGTLPGFVHDVGAAFFPWGNLSPAFRALDLPRQGLQWCRATFESCHPAPDGSYACIARDADATAQHFGSPADGEKWRAVAKWYAEIEPSVIELLMGTFPTGAPVTRLGPTNLATLASIFLASGRGLSQRWFDTPAARRVLPGLALHVDVGPDDPLGAALGFMLGMTATTGGYVVPRGGAQALTNALRGDLEQHGGRVLLGARVTQVIVRNDRACAVRLADGTEIDASVVLADTDAATLLVDLLDAEYVPRRMYDFMQRYPRGWGTFKLDWALSSPVPWNCAAARQSAVVHLGDSLDDLSRFTAQVRSGQMPDHPYLVVGQQSLLDPTRAPDGAQTLWAYSRVPVHPPGGWRTIAEAFADRVEARIEDMAPGFRQCVLARRIVSPLDLQANNANLVGGDLGGGSNAWHRQLLFRPLFPHFRYRMPVPGLYLCSSYAHPGAGAHGMCGFNAAQIALKDLRLT